MTTRRILLISLTAIAAVGFAVFAGYIGGSDPYSVVFRHLGGSVPRERVLYAKQVRRGFEPTFIGVISVEGLTNWPSLLHSVGCSPANGSQRA